MFLTRVFLRITEMLFVPGPRGNVGLWTLCLVAVPPLAGCFWCAFLCVYDIHTGKLLNLFFLLSLFSELPRVSNISLAQLLTGGDSNLCSTVCHLPPENLIYQNIQTRCENGVYSEVPSQLTYRVVWIKCLAWAKSDGWGPHGLEPRCRPYSSRILTTQIKNNKRIPFAKGSLVGILVKKSLPTCTSLHVSSLELSTRQDPDYLRYLRYNRYIGGGHIARGKQSVPRHHVKGTNPQATDSQQMNNSPRV